MTSDTPSYPTRPAYFAHRYCRLLTKACAAQEIGPAATWLCAVVAMQEDAKRYSGPVTYYNEQLLPLIGLTKWESLDQHRKRAMAAGWLHYECRGRRRAGLYWVTIPPASEGLNDGACDEAPRRLYPENGYNKGDNQGYNSGDNKGDNQGELSYLRPDPLPSPKREPAAAGEPPAGLLELIDGWNALGDSIVRKGNGARRAPPSQAAIHGWNRTAKCSERRDYLADVPAILAAIRAAKFCHGQGWFTVPWLFGKNDKGEFNLCQLMAGAHNDKGNQNGHSSRQVRIDKHATGPGQVHNPGDATDNGF